MKSIIENMIEKCRTVSVVGMSKNAGKTVAVNWLIDNLNSMEVSFAITSIGRDGETKDIVTNTEKPQVFLKKGTIVATGKDYFDLIKGVEVLRVTDITSPLGNIVIGRIVQDQFVMIGGPSTTGGLLKLIDIYKELGVDFNIIDGALDRMSLGSPTVADGIILSTGAVVDRNIEKVILKTLHRINLLQIEEVDFEYADLLQDQIDSGQVTIIEEDGKVKQLGISTALREGEKILSSLDDNSKYLILPGSLMASLIKKIIAGYKNYKNLTIVVQDGTKIFIDNNDYINFLRRRVNIRVLRKVEIMGITVNPYSPKGYYFDPDDFIREFRAYIREIPIIDVMNLGDDNN